MSVLVTLIKSKNRMKTVTPASVTEYIKAFPKEVQSRLIQIRETIKATVPDAEESISYAMPAYKLNKKPLVYFAAYEKHIGFYATPTGHSAFTKELSKYKQGKGSVQFPLNEPLPIKLIEKIVKFKAKENRGKAVILKTKKAVSTTDKDIQTYHKALSKEDKAICDLLFQEITKHLPQAENKIWHAHPVWFLDGNPVVGYSKQKSGIRLMFWSGASFEEERLKAGTGKFKDASVFYNAVTQINTKDLKCWLKKSETIQWDYKNIVKRRGVLERLK